MIKEQFGSKEKMVETLTKFSQKIFDHVEGEDKESLQKRLSKASNRTLLKLHKLGKNVEAKWGSKEKLVDDLLVKLGRAKDKDYRSKLLTRTIAWLYDRVTAFERQEKKQATTSTKTAK